MTQPFSEKARRTMRNVGSKNKEVKKREPRNPQGDFEQAFHIVKPGKFEYIENRAEIGLGEVKFFGIPGFPASGFKKAIVASARQVDGLPMTLLRGTLFVQGDINGLVPIKYEKLEMREDPVVVANGSSDLRYRPAFHNWSTVLAIEYNEDILSADQISNLVNISGFCCGIGEGRPERSGGTWGRFKVLSK